MTVVRDLLINFGARLDPNDMGKVNSQVEAAGAAASAIFTTRFLVGIGQVFGTITELASDVEENINVLNQSFGSNTEGVQNWAKEFGDAAGRNRYEMEQTAGVLGSMLNPLMGKNEDLAADMSKRLAELTVDLGSFFNVADNDVLVALRAGISGEAEPLKRFGVIMNEDTLKAYALSQGINKSVKSMSVAEKTALRYNYILDQTSAAHGDAIRTSEGWANASKGLRGKLEEIATTAGLKVLPIFTGVLNYTRKLVDSFAQLVDGTNFFEAALTALAAVAVIVGIKLAIAFAPILIPMLKLALVFAVVTLLLKDFYTFLKGGDSVIGRFIDSVFGPGSAEEALKKMKEGGKEVSDWLQNVFIPWLKKAGPKIATFAGAVGSAFIEVAKYAREFLGVLNDIFDWVAKKGIPIVLDFFEKMSKQKIWFYINPFKMGEVEGSIGSGKSGTGGANRSEEEIKRDYERGYAGSMLKKGNYHSGVRVPLPSRGLGIKNESLNVVNNSNVTVNASTNANPVEIAETTKSRVDAANRAAAAALRQRISK